MFKATIISRKQTIFEGEVKSVFLPGVEGEFEVMDSHQSIISLLKSGEIVINWEAVLNITKGIVMVKDKQLLALVDEN